jgi:hypothetical protein
MFILLFPYQKDRVNFKNKIKYENIYVLKGFSKIIKF